MYYFQYYFGSSRSTADLLTVVSDRIARPFDRSGAIPAVAVDISKAYIDDTTLYSKCDQASDLP